MKKITPQQKAVLDYIVAELQAGRQVPTTAAIAQHIGVKCHDNGSCPSVTDKLRQLAHYGFIFVPPRADKRSLQVLALSDGTPCNPRLQAPPQISARDLTAARRHLLLQAHVRGCSHWPAHGNRRLPYEWCKRQGLITRLRGARCSSVAVLTTRGKQLATKLFS